MHVQFISSYAGHATYGVYVPRLRRDVRITRDQRTGTFERVTAEVTAGEAEDCLTAVREYLIVEHEKFEAWARERGLDTTTQRNQPC